MARVISASVFLFYSGQAAESSGFLAAKAANSTSVPNSTTDTAAPVDLAAASTSWRCGSWCSYSPSATWQWIPACSGCGYGVARNNGCANWCEYSPSSTWQWIPSCEGCNGQNACACSSWCQNVPAQSQSSMTDCCACTSVIQTSCAGWCRHSPSASWADIPSCQGCTSSAACTCSSWCNNVPANSWETVPDCCGCRAGVTQTLPPAPSPVPVSPSSGVSPTPGPPWQTSAACSANAACRAQGLEGDCCPTSDGSMLGCCSER